MAVACVQASVEARRSPCRAHGNFNGSPDFQPNSTMQGVHKDHRTYMDLSRCCLWASKRGGATFTVGVNALSVIQGVQKTDP